MAAHRSSRAQLPDARRPRRRERRESATGIAGTVCRRRRARRASADRGHSRRHGGSRYAATAAARAADVWPGRRCVAVDRRTRVRGREPVAVRRSDGAVLRAPRVTQQLQRTRARHPATRRDTAVARAYRPASHRMNARIAAFWQRVADAPHAHGLYALLRWLDARGDSPVRLGHASHPGDEPLRIGQLPSLAFAPSTVASVTLPDGAAVVAEIGAEVGSVDEAATAAEDEAGAGAGAGASTKAEAEAGTKSKASGKAKAQAKIAAGIGVVAGLVTGVDTRPQPKPKSRPPRVSIHGFGLFGPNGPLPLHLTEYARDRARHHDDGTLTAFADLFHHRLTLLFYRAWADAQPAVSLDRAGHARFDDYLACLIHLGQPSLRRRDSRTDHARFFMAGHFVRQTRNPEGLRAVLHAALGVPVEIVELVPRWLMVDANSRTALGRHDAPNGLGCGAIVGMAVREAQGKFEIRLGPLTRDEHASLLPGTPLARQLAQRVRDYGGIEWDWDVRLMLAAGEIRGATLGAANQPLGLASWLGSRTCRDVASDLAYSPERRASCRARTFHH